MKYKGIELVEITQPQIFNPPKKMLVWDDEEGEVLIERVVAFLPEVLLPVTTIDDNGYRGIIYKHCAEIPEEPKPRRATNRDLAKWLAQGNGEWTDVSEYTMSTRNYPAQYENEPLPIKIKIRKWDDNDWHDPTIDYMGLEVDK